MQSARKYYELKKCIVITILDQKIITESEDYFNCFRLMEKNKLFKFNDDLELYFIELESFDDNRQVINLTDLEEWVMYLKDEGNEAKNDQIEEIMSKKEAIKLANQVLNEITSDEQMRERIRSIELARLDQISREHYARLEGEARGREVGREEGEKITLNLTAKNLKAAGVDTVIIMNATGLNQEQIDEL